MNNFQLIVNSFCEAHGLNSSPETCFIDLLSELGEVGKELLRMSDYGHKKTAVNNEIKGELGDAFYSLIMLANSTGVNLEEELKNALEKYEERFKKKGNAGSD
ncbi:MAG: MazG nucleotide pyrophosphohydrolase domain-containing protein [Candidatus Nanoarchaeia archaeon]|jgi:NTP pyrophosphatase (non-canonical NTP hydrolase)